ncbi:MAG: hypothetical protein JKX84_04460 [Flavobacteriales bacterium]|nr:hypothetical protein [Flavobacteriales bacterium]
MKIVLLTNNSNRGQTLAHLMLRAGLNLKLVVVEDGSINSVQEKGVLSLARQILGPTYRLLKKYVKFSSEDRKALKFEEESITKAEITVNQYIQNLGVTGRPTEIEYLEVSTLNSAMAVNTVVKAKPDLCVVLGTSILRSRMISIPKIGTINAHTSILPEYRGSRSEFWQCYNQDYKNVGVTLHFIDKGVDTGNILFQKKQDVDENPDPNVLRMNNTFAILQNYVAVIQQVLLGDIEPKKQGKCTTPTYRFRDITEKKRIKLYKRLLRPNG